MTTFTPEGPAPSLYQLICQFDAEGIVAKKADCIYNDNREVAIGSEPEL